MEFPQIDPVILSIYEPYIALRWYGMMYLVGFLACWWLGNKRADRADNSWTREQVSDFLFYGFLGVILGGRLGYVFFYHFDYFLADPRYIYQFWDGGMSFHGGLIGVLLAFWYFARKTGKTFWETAEFFAPFVPIGLGAGRLGNFINAELYGRITDLASTPWAMHFPQDPPGIYRHPSQLYQFALEGVLMFTVLFWYSKKPRPRGAIAGLFLALYGTTRFIVEFFREPDAHLKDMAEVITMGQLLSLPMILAGVVLIVWAYKHTDETNVPKNNPSSSVKTKRAKA